MFNTCTLAEVSPTPPWSLHFKLKNILIPHYTVTLESKSSILIVVILARKDRYTSNDQANESKIQYAMHFDKKIEKHASIQQVLDAE